MRILVISQYFWPENFRINDLVLALGDRGHHITVLTGEPNYPSGEIFHDYLCNKDSFRNFFGVTVIRVPVIARGKNKIKLALNYISFILSASFIGPWKLRGEEFDVIFVYEPSPITVGIPAAVMRSIKRAPMVFWVLDLWPQTLRAVGIFKSPILLNLVGQLVKIIYSQCDLILAQSKSFIEHIKYYSPTNVPVQYFPNWAESVFDSTSITPASEIKHRTDSFTIVFAGNIGVAQDFPAILDAAELLKFEKKIHWIIVGSGRMHTWVSKEVERRGLQSQFELLGSFPLERMPSFYAHADALLVSLRDDPIFAMTIPGKLQSYLASGVPVIGMISGEGADIINEYQVGLCAPAGDFNELAKLVLRMSKMSEEQLIEMGKHGKQLYEQQFERGSLVVKAENFFKSLSADSRLAND
jgi:glycosyltransferase involved in cell wall biosynthesis